MGGRTINIFCDQIAITLTRSISNTWHAPRRGETTLLTHAVLAEGTGARDICRLRGNTCSLPPMMRGWHTSTCQWFLPHHGPIVTAWRPAGCLRIDNQRVLR